MKRARDEEQKRERRQMIMDSAWHLYLEMDGVMPPVSKIAGNAGLAKGTVYLYFKTKEEIFLSIVEQQIEKVFADLLQEIMGKSGIRIENLIDIIVSAFNDNAVLKLLSTANSALEPHVDEDFLYRFKRRIARRLADYGNLLENFFQKLPEGAGVRLLLRTYMIILGAHQIVPASRRLEELLLKPGLEIFDVDFKNELREILMILWEGSLMSTEAPRPTNG